MTDRFDLAPPAGDRTMSATLRQWMAPIALGLAMLPAGCMSGPTAANSLRNTAQTAPADLQLTCASAAATTLGVEAASVLPVSSSQIDPQQYRVDLEAKGARATCLIDPAGKVLSVTKV